MPTDGIFFCRISKQALISQEVCVEFAGDAGDGMGAGVLPDGPIAAAGGGCILGKPLDVAAETGFVHVIPGVIQVIVHPRGVTGGADGLAKGHRVGIEALLPQRHPLLFGIGDRIILKIEENREKNFSPKRLQNGEHEFRLFFGSGGVQGVRKMIDAHGEPLFSRATDVLDEKIVHMGGAVARPDDGERHPRGLDLRPVQGAVVLRNVDAEYTQWDSSCSSAPGSPAASMDFRLIFRIFVSQDGILTPSFTQFSRIDPASVRIYQLRVRGNTRPE